MSHFEQLILATRVGRVVHYDRLFVVAFTPILGVLLVRAVWRFYRLINSQK